MEDEINIILFPFFLWAPRIKQVLFYPNILNPDLKLYFQQINCLFLCLFVNYEYFLLLVSDFHGQVAQFCPCTGCPTSLCSIGKHLLVCTRITNQIFTSATQHNQCNPGKLRAAHTIHLTHARNNQRMQLKLLENVTMYMG